MPYKIHIVKSKDEDQLQVRVNTCLKQMPKEYIFHDIKIQVIPETAKYKRYCIGTIVYKQKKE